MHSLQKRSASSRTQFLSVLEVTVGIVGLSAVPEVYQYDLIITL